MLVAWLARGVIAETRRPANIAGKRARGLGRVLRTAVVGEVVTALATQGSIGPWNEEVQDAYDTTMREASAEDAPGTWEVDEQDLEIMSRANEEELHGAIVAVTQNGSLGLQPHTQEKRVKRRWCYVVRRHVDTEVE